MKAHLSTCEACARKLESQQHIRARVRLLPGLEPPPELTVRLRVLASKERLIDHTPGSRLRRWREQSRLTLDNLMRPLALPAAGGLCAALLLFGSLVPTFTLKRPIDDVPLFDVPSTQPVLKSFAPIGFEYGDAEVDLRIDSQGRIINYSFVTGSKENNLLRRSIENNLLFTTFTPATSFGVPKTSTLRLSFRSSRIDVKG